MSQTELPSLVEIPEKGGESFDCPPGIEEQLQQAAFSQTSSTEFVKRRTSLSTGQERDVVHVFIEGETLRVEVEDIVGIVDLTPDSRLQIRPKIGWEEILDMYMLVSDADRAVEHHGIPIKDFFSDDLKFEDIFIIIALNWHNSLNPLYRNGFLRTFETRRYNAVSGRGRIDIERSLQNFDRGIPKQHYVQRDTNYSTSENELLHKAGCILLQLFEQGAKRSQPPYYFEIFSDIRNKIIEFERRGIDSSNTDPSQYRAVSATLLPRQRSYYRKAIEISKMILSSTSGQSLANGAEELTVDYIIDMESLFENFTQVVLEKELTKLLSNPLQTSKADIRIDDEPTIPVYADSTQANYRPDHVLRVDNETVAVLDSKYYSAENDPSIVRHARTTMFAYAFLLETEKMAFLCPTKNINEPSVRQLAERSGEVTTIAPDQSFTIEKYRNNIRSYLQEILDDYLEGEGMLSDLSTFSIALRGDFPSDPTQLIQYPQFEAERPKSFARDVMRKAARESTRIHGPRGFPDGQRIVIIRIISNKIINSDFDYYIPLFIPSEDPKKTIVEELEEEWDGDAILTYGIRQINSSEIEVENLGINPLDWHNDL